MRNVRLAAAALIWTACGREPRGPMVTVANRPVVAVVPAAGPMIYDLADGAAGLVDDRLFAWDRAWADGGGGVAEYGTVDGKLRRTRAIAGLRINGAPGFWDRIPGGYLAAWDGPTAIRDDGDHLAVRWVGAGDDWFDSHVIVDGSLVIGRGRDTAAVVRLDLATGAEQWAAPLVGWSQDVTIETDGRQVYATWQEYDPQAPTPTIAIPRRVRAYDLATGQPRWTFDFADEPDQLAISRDTIVAAWPDRLQLIDGPTGRVRARARLAPLNARLLIDDDQVIALDQHAVVALALATGAERWRTDLRYDGRPAMARAGATIVVSGQAGKVTAFDRATGAAAWTMGLGVEAYRLTASGAALLAAGAGVATLPLTPIGAAETARIHGRVVAGGCGPVAGAQVTVDGADAPMSADGGYATTVVARGVVVIAVTADDASTESWEGRARAAVATIRLDGHGDYLVPELTAGRCGG